MLLSVTACGTSDEASRLGQVNADGCFGGAASFAPGTTLADAQSYTASNANAIDTCKLESGASDCTISKVQCTDGNGPLCTYELCPVVAPTCGEWDQCPSGGEICGKMPGYFAATLADAMDGADQAALDRCSRGVYQGDEALQGCHGDGGWDTYASCSFADGYGFTCVGRACGEP